MKYNQTMRLNIIVRIITAAIALVLLAACNAAAEERLSTELTPTPGQINTDVPATLAAADQNRVVFDECTKRNCIRLGAAVFRGTIGAGMARCSIRVIFVVRIQESVGVDRM